MHTTGLIIASFGGLFLFGSVLALACMPNKNDGDKLTIPQVFDLFFLGGIIGSFLNLLQATKEGLKNRSSPLFPLLVLFGLSIGLFVIGLGLMSFSQE